MGAIDADKPVEFHDHRLNLSRDIHPNPSEAAFSTVFFQDDFRPGVGSDAISGVVVDPAGMKVSVKFGDSRSRPFSTSRYMTVSNARRTNDGARRS